MKKIVLSVLQGVKQPRSPNSNDELEIAAGDDHMDDKQPKGQKATSQYSEQPSTENSGTEGEAAMVEEGEREGEKESDEEEEEEEEEDDATGTTKRPAAKRGTRAVQARNNSRRWSADGTGRRTDLDHLQSANPARSTAKRHPIVSKRPSTSMDADEDVAPDENRKVYNMYIYIYISGRIITLIINSHSICLQ